MTTSGNRAVRTNRSERGSALLIVFVFAAVVLILLYREIPIATFEAQRQKEQLAVDRGHEYQRAVQLFYRKFRGQYPASVDQLQNTNGMRFLRRKYKDPITGKDDWRLLHAGPGGMLLDSKVNPFDSTKQAKTSQSDSASNPAPASSGAASSPSAALPGSDPSAALTTEDPTLPKPKHSPPAIAATGGSGGNGSAATPTAAELDQDPSKPLLPSTSDSTTTADASGAAAGAGANGANGTRVPGQGGASQLTTVAHAGNGTLSGGGGIAGVGFPPEVKGRSVKTINDQKSYDLWEFYYDPSKDTGMSSVNGMQNNGGQNPLQNGNAGAGATNGAAGTGNPPAQGAPTGGNSNGGQGSTAPDGTMAPNGGGASPSGSVQSPQDPQ